MPTVKRAALLGVAHWHVPLMLRGVKTEGPMAPDIDLSNQRPAEYMFSAHVQQKMSEIHAAKTAKAGAQQATAAE